jgi:hypothetical protein
MAAGYACSSGAAFAVTSGAKTLINLISGATSAPPVLTEFGVSFDGVTSSAVPALVELCASTQAAAGTPGTVGTITQIRGYAGLGVASGVTVSGQYSAEPTVLVAVKQWYVPAFMGLLVIQFPLGREAMGFDTASTSMKGIALRVSAPAAVNVRGYIEWDE